MMDMKEDIFAGFDLDEMRALEEGDLSLFSNFLDANFRLTVPNSSASESDPSPQSTTPVSSEELNIILGMEEEDHNDRKHTMNLFDQHLNPTISSFNNNSDNYNNNHIPVTSVKSNSDAANKTSGDEIAPPPLVVCPIEVGKTSITLQKNQLCACKECGKLFKSIWYLRQHAVRHSNERPFKCNYCQKAFKFRSNLYQHNCSSRSERMRQRGSNVPLRNLQSTNNMSPNNKKRFYTRGIAYTEMYSNPANGSNGMNPQLPSQQVLYGGQQIDAMNGPNGSIFPNTNTPMNSNMQSIDPSYQNFANQQMGMDSQLMANYAVGEQDQIHENNSIRHKPLDPEYIDNYLQKNRHRIYSCRRCKLNFPYREYLQRHLAYHNDLDNRPFGCEQCPQRFANEKQLNSHIQKHVEDSPHRCIQCNGAFRSSLALRRHQDQSRQCYRPPFGIYQQPSLMISPNAPLDEYAFIDEPPTSFGLNRQKTIDSGVASDSSTHSYNTSPVSNCNEDDLELNIQNPFGAALDQKLQSPQIKQEDETDSGIDFRSRLNSTTQSCSPGSSSFTSESGSSPSRKYSKASSHHSHEQPSIHGTIQAGSVADYITNSYNSSNGSYSHGYQHNRSNGSGPVTRASTVHYGGQVGNNWTAISLRSSNRDS
ncbi:hypothetical protein M3Y96_00371400 [Aphelenchoides besseyi]|nr:hypothetical protein M3Y96_00371400 [Aphelenchoides besseyi]